MSRRPSCIRTIREIVATVGATYLVAFTETADTARRLARLRSPIPLIALTPELDVTQASAD